MSWEAKFNKREISINEATIAIGMPGRPDPRTGLRAAPDRVNDVIVEAAHFQGQIII